MKQFTQRRDHQALAKAPRARQEVDALVVAHKLINVAGLVDIEVTALDDIPKDRGADG